MGLLIFFLSAIFIIYFFVVGLRWVSAVPLLVLIVYMFGSNPKTNLSEGISLDDVHGFFTNHALVIARSLAVLGGWGLLDIYADFGSLDVFRVVGIHLFLWLGSYLIDYEDGKIIFQMGYLLSLMLLFIQFFDLFELRVFIHILMVFFVMTMGVYSSIVFCMGGLGKKVDQISKYILFILFNVTVILLIYLRGRDDIPSALVLSQIYLMALYCVIYGIKRYYNEIRDHIELDHDSLVSEVLDGKRILGRKSPFISEVIVKANSFIGGLDNKTTFFISLMNVILLFLQVYLFVYGFGTQSMRMTQGIFRFGVAAFFVNYLLLREIGFYHELQRTLAFIFINFGIYLSIINIFGDKVYWMVVLGVGRSLLNSGLIFMSNKLHFDKLLEKTDYKYWLGTTAIATLFNLYFIVLLPLSGQFIFSFIFLYLGVQLVLFLYALRYINAQKFVPLSAQEKLDEFLQNEK